MYLLTKLCFNWLEYVASCRFLIFSLLVISHFDKSLLKLGYFLNYAMKIRIIHVSELLAILYLNTDTTALCATLINERVVQSTTDVFKQLTFSLPQPR